MFVTGDWIGWKVKTDYRFSYEDGIYRGTFDLPVGTHEYKYVIVDYDGTGTVDWDTLNPSNRTIVVS